MLFPRAQTPRLHDAIIALCREHGFTPEVAQEAQSWHTIASLVGAGLGVALAPASVRRLRVPYVRCITLARSTTEVRVDVCHAGSPSPAAAAFVAVTRAVTRAERATATDRASGAGPAPGSRRGAAGG